MVYLTHYEEYPIYEPAEGGYYYAGRQVVAYERMSLRKAKDNFDELFNDAMKENENLSEKEKWKYLECSNSPKGILYRYGKYIGEGESYVIERKLGRYEKGYEPYC